MCISPFLEVVSESWAVETSHGVGLQVWTAVPLAVRSRGSKISRECMRYQHSS